MYSNVTAKVKLKEGLTDSFPIQVGTRQGCNLSPTLFNLFINDLPEQFTDNKCDSITLNNELINCVMYADDLVLLSRSESGMHTCLTKLTDYCNKWRLTINIRKTKIIVINGHKNKTYAFKIHTKNLKQCHHFVILA